jgi:hypothetical protein
MNTKFLYVIAIDDDGECYLMHEKFFDYTELDALKESINPCDGIELFDGLVADYGFTPLQYSGVLKV